MCVRLQVLLDVLSALPVLSSLTLRGVPLLNGLVLPLARLRGLTSCELLIDYKHSGSEQSLVELSALTRLQQLVRWGR